MSELTQDPLVCVGSYAPPERDSIHLLRLDRGSGSLSLIGKASGIANPTFQAFETARGLLFAVSETESDGTVVSYRYDGASGTIREINRQPTNGGLPCHLQLHPSGKWLLAVNYLNGRAVSVYPLDADGTIGVPACQVNHAGTGMHPTRQDGPHPHSIFRIPGTDNYLVPDLGTDLVYSYGLDTMTGKLNVLAENRMFAGGGPRHLAYHPRLPIVYVIHEMGAAVTVHRLDTRTGRLSEVQRLSTLQGNQVETYPSSEICAEILVSESGTYLYGSNRQADTISVFRIEADGRLAMIGNVHSAGRTPRSFTLVKGSRYLLAANQDSDRIVVFEIGNDGIPYPNGHSYEVTRPAFIGAI